MANKRWCSRWDWDVEVNNGETKFYYLDRDPANSYKHQVPREDVPESIHKKFEMMLHESGWVDGCPIPDGLYSVDSGLREVRLAVGTGSFIVAANESLPMMNPPREPTIPILLEVFSLSLSRPTYDEKFLPAFLDLKNARLRGLSLDKCGPLIRRLRGLAYSVQATHIMLECLVRDWLCVSWKRFIWLVIGALASCEAVRRLFELF